MNRSLRVSLTALLIALSLIPALSVGAVLGWQIYQREHDHALLIQRQITDRAASEIITYLEGAEAELFTMIQAPALRADRTASEAVLSEALFYRDTFDELAIVDAGGREQARVSRLGVAPPNALLDHSAKALFLEPMRSDKPYYQGFERSSTTGEPLLLMAVPTLDVSSGRPDGVLIGSVRMRAVFDRVTSIPFGESGTILVIDSDEKVVAHSAREGVDPTVHGLSVGADGVGRGVGGEPVLEVYRPVSQGNLTFTINSELPLAEASAPLVTALATAGVLLLVIALAAGAITILTVGRVTAPIQELATATHRISAGDTTRQVAITRRDEIGSLQRDFNQMVADLQAQRAAIDERTAELQSSLNRQRDLLETVAQLSAPLLPVWEGVVVLPIVGHVDAQRGAALTSVLVEGVAQRRARVAIIDITGLAAVNDDVVSILVRAAQAVELLGAHAMLAGVSAAFAQRIVTSNVNLGSIASFRDLQSAAEAAIARLGGIPSPS